LRAKVNYRRLNQEYTNYVLSRQQRNLALPVVRMAQAETTLAASSNLKSPIPNLKSRISNLESPIPKSEIPQWKRWNDYGIGLLEQSQFSAAAEAFRRASALDPQAPDLLVNAAIAEMRTERFGPELDQFRSAAALLDSALKLAPAHERARFYRALVWRAEGKVQAAAAALGELAGKYPRDREAQRQFALTLYGLGRLAEARSGFERILSIDPTDFLAHQFLAPLYASEGREADSERARALYFQWRDDPRAESIAARFFAAHPEWADARNPAYVIGQHTPRRPVLTGAQAVPER
jgi:tetratricopeptide (TPR) repeat protein